MNRTKFKLIILALSAYFGFFAYGCQAAKVNLNGFNDEKLSSTSDISVTDDETPDFSNAQSNGYIIFQGSCINKVSSFYMKVKTDTSDGEWNSIPSTAPTRDSSFGGQDVPAGTNYDVDCSDNKFSFYVYVSQVATWLGFTSAQMANFHPQLFYLKGKHTSTGVDTNILEFDPDSAPVKYLTLKKGMQPENQATVGNCFEIVITPLTKNYTETKPANDIEFDLKLGGNTFSVYADSGSCSTSSSSISTSKLIFPKNQYQYRLYYKHSTPEDISFTLVPTNTTISALSALNIKIHTVTAAYYELDYTPDKIVKNECYALKILRKDILTGSDFPTSTPGEGFTLSLHRGGAAATGFSTYSNPDCSGAPSLAIAPYSSYSVPIYYKITSELKGPYILRAESNDTFVTGELTLNIDSSGDLIPRKIGFYNSWSNMALYSCQRFFVSFYNSNWQTVRGPVTPATAVNFEISGNAEIHDNEGCPGAVISGSTRQPYSSNYDPDKVLQIIYVKRTGTGNITIKPVWDNNALPSVQDLTIYE